ncbi:S1 family peptidase [Luteimonas aquatica]|uniref:S1 family peptidase n=1 Tax=Luteimonas aquatica TaxID=450364 RepID=UPI001F5683C1|nr:S1 family peptidase [Luteimonas aquatica]
MDIKPLHTVVPFAFAIALTVGSASSAGPVSLEKTLEYEHFLKVDAQEYARHHGVGVDEALRRLNLQAGTAELIESLRSAYRDRVAGIYVEYAPAPRVVVRLAGAAPVSPRLVAVGADMVAVDFQSGAAHTQRELQGIVDRNIGALKSRLPGLQGLYADEKTGDVVLYVTGEAADASARQAAASALLGVPARIKTLPAPVVEQAVRGSGHLTTCTGGFVVKHTATGNTGLATAAHCGNSQSYTGLDGATSTMTFQSESYTASDDAQWHTTSAADEPKFYASATSLRTLTGRRTQASTAVGNNICHYGKTTGYSCGDVVSTSYSNVTCGATTCASTYIALEPPASGTGLACAGGDSGGPWFISTVATGLHKAGSSTGTGIGQCALAVYTSTDRISALGLQLVYGP